MPHSHPTPSIESLMGSGSPLKISSYEAEQLGELIEKFCKLFAKRLLSSRQKEAVRLWQTDSTGLYDLHSERYSEKDVLKAFIRLFDDLFFFGALHAKITLSFNPNQGNGVLLGECCSKGSGKALVTIYRPSRPYGGRKDRITQFLEVLLHEMCHAMFQVYACKRGACYKKYESCGTTGHAAAWQYAAYAVELTCGPVLGLRFNLHRRYSLIREGGRGRREHLGHWELDS